MSTLSQPMIPTGLVILQIKEGIMCMFFRSQVQWQGTNCDTIAVATRTNTSTTGMVALPHQWRTLEVHAAGSQHTVVQPPLWPSLLMATPVACSCDNPSTLPPHPPLGVRELAALITSSKPYLNPFMNPSLNCFS